MADVIIWSVARAAASLRSIAAVAAISVQLPAGEDVLEPSVLNEVEHALERAEALTPAPVPSAASAAFAKLYETNGLSKANAAVALVSSQRADGRWFEGTNDVTHAAAGVLRRLAGLEAPQSVSPEVPPAKSCNIPTSEKSYRAL